MIQTYMYFSRVETKKNPHMLLLRSQHATFVLPHTAILRPPYLAGSVFLRSRSKYSVAERFNPPSGLDVSWVRFQSVTLAPTMPKVATATPNRMGPMLCPGMGRSAEVDAAVSAALDGLVVLEKARAAAPVVVDEGRVRMDEMDAIAVAAADELGLLCADAAARENRAAVQRAMLGTILVSEEDMVVKIDLALQLQNAWVF